MIKRLISERDCIIFLLWLSGISYNKIAKEFRISHGRVQQIVTNVMIKIRSDDRRGHGNVHSIEG